MRRPRRSFRSWTCRTTPPRAKIIILCEKVSKEDIKVRFFDYNGWEEWADFGPAGVHKQYAISLTAPRYSDPGIVL